ncbi:MAG: hypothetical protein OXB96_02350 [Candidatus Kaiserbacteria bacterium]|nr:hypothetical protein [Candidatus Kaiserbacteria bacterium]
MSTNNSNAEYAVSFTPFSEKHYVKKFRKKYKDAWDKTQTSIERSFRMFDTLLERGVARMIIDKRGIKICKTEFRVAKTTQSRHGSGNRCIVAMCAAEKQVIVLLVYHKSHLSGSGGETDAWKTLVKKNFLEYKDLL